MKKYVLISLLLILFIIIYIFPKESKFPKSIPTVSVLINTESYKTIAGEGNWFDSKKGGNSHIGFVDEKLKNEAKFIDVKNEDTLSFDISYKNGIKEVSIDQIEFYDIISAKDNLPTIAYKYVNFSKNEYTLKAPKESGEYYYAFRIKWDDTHDMNYLFKIKVQ